ncbi:hypothetical protein J2795_002050 [Chryseobacterium bernardetii]|uniref:Uncharacterized protein n=1 Tax=Chryseobacterium bernardetii TaxID=1241978 RepID=A0ACC6IUD9_9FLAO|nr:hypothetical protein [Chryseobacterium vietnamense]MDR6441350.1 hypothetical protein [Chryseobacterium bernardetii]
MKDVTIDSLEDQDAEPAKETLLVLNYSYHH